MHLNNSLGNGTDLRGRITSIIGVLGGIYMSIPDSRARFRSCVNELRRDALVMETCLRIDESENVDLDLSINTVTAVLTACEILVSGGEINDVLRVLETLSAEERGFVAISWDLFLDLPFDDLDLMLSTDSDAEQSIH